VPSRIFIVDQLPHSRSGKVAIHDLKEILLGEHADAKHDQNIKEIFLEAVSRCLQIPPDQVQLDARVEDTSAWDSLSFLTLIAELEKRFTIEFTPVEVMNVKMLASLLDIVEKKLAG
jgi:acyl carrier protein